MKEKTSQSSTITVPGISYLVTHAGGTDPGPFPPDSGGPVPPSTTYVAADKSIIYEVGRRKSNYCNHVEIQRSRNMLPLYGETATVATGGGNAWFREELWPAAHFYDRDGVSWPPFQEEIANWEELSSKAVQSMWPEVEQQVSSINFTVELPQVRSLPKQLQELKKLGSTIASKALRQPLKKFLTLVQGAGVFASKSTLISEFGIRPLLDDIVGFSNTYRRAREAVDRILSNENKELVSHYQSTPLMESQDDEYIQVVPSGGHPRHSREIRYTKVRYNATMRYTYRLLDHQRELAHTLGLYDALGLNLNAQTVWDAIPFSFLVDYFARVGDFLDQWKWRSLEPIVQINDFCHSRTLEYSDSRFYERRYNSGHASPKFLTGIDRVRKYTRKRHIPDTYTAIQLPGLNTRKLTLIGALIGANRR